MPTLLSLLNNLLKMTVLSSGILFFRKLRTVINVGGENTHPGKRNPKLQLLSLIEEMDAQWSEALLVNRETEGATETQGQP